MEDAMVTIPMEELKKWIEAINEGQNPEVKYSESKNEMANEAFQKKDDAFYYLKYRITSFIGT